VPPPPPGDSPALPPPNGRRPRRSGRPPADATAVRLAGAPAPGAVDGAAGAPHVGGPAALPVRRGRPTAGRGVRRAAATGRAGGSAPTGRLVDDRGPRSRPPSCMMRGGPSAALATRAPPTPAVWRVTRAGGGAGDQGGPPVEIFGLAPAPALLPPRAAVSARRARGTGTRRPRGPEKRNRKDCLVSVFLRNGLSLYLYFKCFLFH